MKAAQINEYGGPEVLQVTSGAPKPSPKEGEVLVEARAASVNPFDIWVREGSVQQTFPLKFPATLGGDVAGVVSELGPSVSGFEVGEEVYGQANAVGGVGSFAEFTPVKVTSLSAKPKTIDFVTAAAVPLTASSAYQALVDHLELKRGQKLLIHGGAGGIGSFAIQIAKHVGAYVATTASQTDIAFVKGLGADEVIDYKNQDFTTIIRDYDAVFDTVGGETATKSYAVIKPGGKLVSMTAPPNEELAKKHRVTALHQQSKVTAGRLTELARLIDSGVIKVQVDKVFPLEQVTDALAYLQSSQHRGKVVLKVK